MISANRSALAFALVLVATCSIAADSSRDGLVVFAAASLTNSLQQISDAYTKRVGVPVKLSFAASSTLARQIEAGARADVFLSADQEWMDYLAERGLIDVRSRSDLLANRLALIAPRDSRIDVKLGPQAPLLSVLGASGRLAMGDPDFVPAGKYAKAALTSFDLWRALEPRLARAENVRVALSYVARGEAPLGIVYLTDALVEPRVRIVTMFPQTSHPPIAYPVARTTAARPQASSYLEFLHSPFAQSMFTAAGFITPHASPAH
ncbi:MAG TPA: molybdate ABC transporter substrate-binding protein [Steroidobacter sp.]|jgi:molybdate transport system substrate-binding protein|nr:molybdate ABC transporter substrate-binding protein [Steroidobacter sp.]